MSQLHNMKHKVDPKEKLLSEVGDIPAEIVSGVQVLVATYIRPETTQGGIIITEKAQDEDKFQGKCGLVIALGPLAFKDSEKYKFAGFEAKVGDWVWFRPVDGAALSLNKVHCRSVDDHDIRGKIPHPDVIL